MKEMREKLESHELEEEFTASIQKPIDLLDMQMKRVTLKKPFKTFAAPGSGDIDGMWQHSNCLAIEPSLQVMCMLNCKPIVIF